MADRVLETLEGRAVSVPRPKMCRLIGELLADCMLGLAVMEL